MAIGAAATVLCCAALGIGLTDRLDRFGLDLHFRHFGAIEADPRIVMIDIDDQALSAMPEWPWPRRRFAQLVTTLRELGAEAIVLDLVFADSTAPRADDPRLSRHYDLEVDSHVKGDPSLAPLIYDDEELRDAIAHAGNVYIATTAALVHARGGWRTPRTGRSMDAPVWMDQAVRLLEHEPTLDAESLALRIPGITENDAASLRVTVRVARLLEESYSLQESQVVARLAGEGDIDSEVIRSAYPAARRLAAARLARGFFGRTDQAEWAEFLHWALPDLPEGALTPERAILMRSFRAERSWRWMQPQWSRPEHGSWVDAPMAYDFVLPLDKIAEASRGVGLVSYLPDPVDGRLRSIPLLSVSRDRLLPHLGFLVATDLMGITGDSTAIRSGRIEWGDLRIPIDRRGETLINWYTASSTSRWEDLFTHIPVTRVLEIALNREAIEDNRRRLGLAWAELVEGRHRETPAEYYEYVRLVNERSATDAAVQGLDDLIKEIEQEALQWLEWMVGQWRRAEPQNDEERAERHQIMQWWESLGVGGLEERLRESDGRLEARNAELLAELKPRLYGAICLVGYTASAQADLVATPIADNIPGVMAHANVINMMLQRHFVRRASLWADLLLCTLSGLLVTWNAARRGPLTSLVLALALAAALFALGGAMFYFAGLYLATVPVMVCLALPWGAVTVYRQLTEERARRSFERALGQYTSPAIATRIAEHADARDLAPQSAQVTCFFCDLEGFTALSERLGPERTRQVLNPYLRHVSRVLAERNAIVNKFIGDGVFAFFNAPILPCDDHARAACDAALAAREAVHDADHRKREDHAISEVRLSMRIGLATGAVFVGDYGSDTKLDYTCIGDTVNVASRLEQANKLLGTKILVNEGTRDQWAATVRDHTGAPADKLCFRPVGLIEVVGRVRPVSAFELVGLDATVDEGRRRFIERFSAAVGQYQACEWGLCQAALQECTAIDPQDRLVRLYTQAVTRLQQVGTPPDWNGALVLGAG